MTDDKLIGPSPSTASPARKADRHGRLPGGSLLICRESDSACRHECNQMGPCYLERPTPVASTGGEQETRADGIEQNSARVNSFQCAARKQALPEPADCDWPFCGCDPHATKVIEALTESGWVCDRTTPTCKDSLQVAPEARVNPDTPSPTEPHVTISDLRSTVTRLQQQLEQAGKVIEAARKPVKHFITGELCRMCHAPYGLVHEPDCALSTYDAAYPRADDGGKK